MAKNLRADERPYNYKPQTPAFELLLLTTSTGTVPSQLSSSRLEAIGEIVPILEYCTQVLVIL